MLKMSNQRTYNSLEALDEVWRLLDDESDCRNNEGDNLDEVINLQEADILDDEAEVGELEGEVNAEIVPSSRYNRKQLTKSRIVNSIDNAEDVNNYTLWQPPENTKTLQGRIGKETISFTNQIPSRKGRAAIRNVITPPLGVREVAKQVNMLLSAFELFITPEYLDQLVLYSNLKITDIM